MHLLFPYSAGARFFPGSAEAAANMIAGAGAAMSRTVAHLADPDHWPHLVACQSRHPRRRGRRQDLRPRSPTGARRNVAGVYRAPASRLWTAARPTAGQIVSVPQSVNADELRKQTSLLDENLTTQEEFDIAKRRLLGL
jgi:hypothetical protein